MNDPVYSPARVLIVDDVPENLAVLGELLHNDGYLVQVANGGAVALRLAQAMPSPELILLDVNMPDMDGYEVLRRLRAQPATRDIPVLFLTARSDAGEEEYGLLQGAADYLTKPIRPAVVLARVRTQLQAKRLRDVLSHQNSLLEAEVQRRMVENDLIQQLTIRALAHLAETRDAETGDHILRTQGYMELLARRLSRQPEHTATLDEPMIQQLVRSAPLHDIGKVGIPDHILLKRARLDAAEWEVMKTHARLGAEAIGQAERDIDRPLPFLSVARQIAHHHHERWDGHGYPDGLAGTDIPLAARLMAVADVFDALVTPRVYKPAFEFERARRAILDGRGSHFDPQVVDAFSEVYDEFVAVACSHGLSPGGGVAVH